MAEYRSTGIRTGVRHSISPERRILSVDRAPAALAALAGALLSCWAGAAGGQSSTDAAPRPGSAVTPGQALPALDRSDPVGDRPTDWLNSESGYLADLIGPSAHSGSSLVLNVPLLNGAGLGVGSPDGRFRVSSFMSPIRSTDDFGMRRDKGVSNGVILSATPIRAHRDALVVTGAYLQGQSGAGDPVEPQGRYRSARLDRFDADDDEFDLSRPERRLWTEARSLATESELWDGRLSVRAEHAQTTFGYENEPDRAITDEGQSLEAYLSLWEHELAGQHAGWYVGVEQQDVGPWLRSLSKPGIPSPGDARSAFSTWQWAGLTLDLAAGSEEENVSASEIRPAFSENWQSAWIRYGPDLPAGRWYGEPSLSVRMERADYGEVDVPDLYTEVPLDGRVSNRALSAKFDYEWGSVDVGYAESEDRDLTGAFPDLLQERQDIKVRYRVRGGFSIRAGIRHEKKLEVDTGETTRQWRGDFRLSWSSEPKNVDLKLRYGIRDERTRLAPADTRNRLGLDLEWQAVASRPGRPGVKLWFEGDGTVESTDSDEYRILAGVRVDYD